MFDRKEWRKKNSEKIKAKVKEYYERNREKIKAYNKEYYKEYNKEYNKKNREKIRATKKEYYADNREKIRAQDKEYYENNREKVKEQKREYVKTERGRLKNREHRNKYYYNKRKTDPKFKFNNRMSTAVRLSLKGSKAGRHWENLTGYSLSDLMKRLKSTLPENYTWQDFLDGKLHVDHIIPISAYEFDKAEGFQFKECWSLNNLRLLPVRENLSKGNKIIKDYQLALKI